MPGKFEVQMLLKGERMGIVQPQRRINYGKLLPALGCKVCLEAFLAGTRELLTADIGDGAGELTFFYCVETSSGVSILTTIYDEAPAYWLTRSPIDRNRFGQAIAIELEAGKQYVRRRQAEESKKGPGASPGFEVYTACRRHMFERGLLDPGVAGGGSGRRRALCTGRLQISAAMRSPFDVPPAVHDKTSFFPSITAAPCLPPHP